jgi:hypothetical protein
VGLSGGTGHAGARAGNRAAAFHVQFGMTYGMTDPELSSRRGIGRAAVARRPRWRLCATGLAMALLAACGGTAGEDRLGAPSGPGTTTEPPASETTAAPPTRSTATTPSTRPPSRTSTPPTAPTRKPEVTEPVEPGQSLMRLRGRIIDGVEPGCIVLNAEGGAGTWLLLRSANWRPLGGLVEVTGYPIPGLATTCQQGRPFRVVSIRSL